MILFITYSADHNEILYASRPCTCRDVYNISLWSVEHILNQSTLDFVQISKSIEIPLVGLATEQYLVLTIATRGLIHVGGLSI